VSSNLNFELQQTYPILDISNVLRTSFLRRWGGGLLVIIIDQKYTSRKKLILPEYFGVSVSLPNMQNIFLDLSYIYIIKQV